jgi:hypothetical protein
MTSPSQELQEIVGYVSPHRTALLLGAGSSVSSGGPLAADLCRELELQFSNGEYVSDDLAEVASWSYPGFVDS